jgi:hypothetical protein
MRRFRAFHAIVFATCVAAFSPAAFAVSSGEFLAEAAVGALCGYGVTTAGFALVYLANDATSHNDGNVALVATGSALVVAAYPAATATGAYLTGEVLGGPSANKGAAWGWPALAAYAETVVLGGTALILSATNAAANEAEVNDIGFGLFLLDVVSKPFLVAYVYNKVKEPASPVDSRLAVEPYVCTSAASDGRPVPLYGVTLSF